MSLRITFDLSDNDLDHFREIMGKAMATAETSDGRKITDAAAEVLREIDESKAPDFITERLGKLQILIDMVHDDGWALPDEEAKRVLSALAYFSDPEDLIPDEIPGLGFLDDAIMIELAVRELKHEIDAYADFCTFRQAESARRGESAEDLGRSEWLVERRKSLHQRMRRRRRGPRRGRRGKSSSSVNLFG